MMTPTPLLRAAATIALIPALAFAQRGIGPSGMGSGRRGGGISRDPGIAIPKIVNPVNLLIEHRQALALTDTQFARIVVIKRDLDAANAPLMRRLDSVQRVFKGGAIVFGNRSMEKRDSLAEAQSVVQEVQAGVRSNMSDSREHAYALLSASQLSKAQTFEAAAEQALVDEKKGKGRGS